MSIPSDNPHPIKSRYPVLRGRNWLRSISKEDRRAFSQMGLSKLNATIEGGIQSLGGKTRAATGQRDSFARYWSTSTRTKVFCWRDHLSDSLYPYEKGETVAEHTYSCIAAEAKATFRRWAWEQRWPNYHKACGAHGYFESTYDPSPAGVSLSPGTMVDAELCDDCIGNGCCPRCGEQAWLAEDFGGRDGVTCPFCEWNELAAMEPDAEAKGLVVPAEHECYCWEFNLKFEEA